MKKKIFTITTFIILNFIVTPNYASNAINIKFNFKDSTLLNTVKNSLIVNQIAKQIENKTAFKKLNFIQKIKHKILKNKFKKLLTNNNSSTTVATLATLSLLCGIAILPAFLLGFSYTFLLALLGFICGIFGLIRIKKNEATLRGKRQAIIGMFLCGAFILIVLGTAAALLGAF